MALFKPSMLIDMEMGMRSARFELTYKPTGVDSLTYDLSSCLVQLAHGDPELTIFRLPYLWGYRLIELAWMSDEETVRDSYLAHFMHEEA